jgi:hypothetical protein
MRRFVPDLIEISTAARIAKAMHWPNGYLAGHTPEGFPVRIKYGTVVVDLRQESRLQ